MKDLFKNKVYKICSSIPKGKVATYGQLARLAGKPKAARAVGVFMKNNPDAPIVPCHRVVASDGGLTGYSGEGGIAQKKKMLKKEGVLFKGDRVDLSISKWKK
jgi:O-6-methylguanine DNA methyltransferase